MKASSAFLILFALGLILAPVIHAESPAEIRERMAERLPRIDQLKAREVVGENNQGFLEVRGKADDQAATLVREENGDRSEVYRIIASQTGSTPEDVGRARARQIVANSASGVWVQDPSGRWFRK